ncbi:uncharacterized protein TNCV_3773871 [Trichonephila clavipes]|nr:uncharacterized protein TNCV_3773871 [Trichonephila clavipes]
MPNSPSQTIADMRQIWIRKKSGYRASQGRGVRVRIQYCDTLAEHCLVEEWLLGAFVCVATHVVAGCQAMTSHIITRAVGGMCRCKAKAGLMHPPRGLHTRTRLSSLLKLNLDSSLKMTWFHSAAFQFPRLRHHSKGRH